MNPARIRVRVRLHVKAPQELGPENYYRNNYEENIADVSETYPQNLPSGNYPAGDGANDVYDAFPNSPSAETGYFIPQYNHRTAPSKNSIVEPYYPAQHTILMYPENYALQANMHEIIGQEFGAQDPSDFPQNAQFGNKMDRSVDRLEASEQQSAFEREPEDDSMFEATEQVLSETAQLPAIYPDLPNTEPRHIERSDGVSNRLPAVQEDKPSAHHSVEPVL